MSEQQISTIYKTRFQKAFRITLILFNIFLIVPISLFLYSLTIPDVGTDKARLTENTFQDNIWLSALLFLAIFAIFGQILFNFLLFWLSIKTRYFVVLIVYSLIPIIILFYISKKSRYLF
jgi:ABC-type proline/glycine betaine transport system permease subunit